MLHSRVLFAFPILFNLIFRIAFRRQPSPHHFQMDPGALSSFFETISGSAFSRDPLLKNFKRYVLIINRCHVSLLPRRGDVEASLKAAVTGKFHEYWTVDKV